MNNPDCQHPWFITGGLILALLFTTNAWATRLNVKAVLADGSAAGSGVRVNVTSGAFSATALTANNSRASFRDVPEGSATVSGQLGTLAGQRTVNVRGKNQNVELALRAPAGAAPPPPGTTSPIQPPTVSLRINNGATCVTTDNVVLNNSVSGPAPRAYRAGEDRTALRNAAWQPYNASPAYRMSTGAGTKTVYLQVQSLSSGQELVSEIASDTINRVAPLANATLAINNGTGTTFAQKVTLNNTASFTPDGSNPKYIASERSDFSGATWQPYSSAPQFTLSAGAGTKTVYFMATREVCGSVVGTRPVSDTITLGEITAVEPVVSGAAPTITTHTFNWNTAVKPSDVVSYAQGQGYTFSASRTGGNGTCSRQGAHLIATPTSGSGVGFTRYDDLKCTFNLFGGRSLNSGWKTGDIAVKTSNLYPSSYASPILTPWVVGTDRPNFSVSWVLPELTFGPLLAAPAPAFPSNGSADAMIDRLVIKGPSTDWHDAFKR